MASPNEAEDVGYSYIRFSHPTQAKGDSLGRQTRDAEDWCRRNKVRLDASTTLHDLGRSAFTGKHRQNPDRHALAALLKMVEQGKVPRGSYLIIENLDRLSREHIRPALKLLLDLIEAGIRVVQLKPVEQVFDENVEPMQLMMAIMELSRGHSESAMKSKRVGDAWKEKKRRAAHDEAQKPTARMGKDCKVLTHRVPAWLKVVDGKPVPIPSRVAALTRVLELAAAGHGHATIIPRLIAENVRPFGSAGTWTKVYVWRLMSDRRLLGEFQPRDRDGRPDGPPIPNYFPAVVSQELFDRVHAAMAQRKRSHGRPCRRHINVFAGLIKNARDHSSYYCTTRPNAKERHLDPARRQLGQRVLINFSALEGKAPSYSFPFPTFEDAILSKLAEIDPAEILNGGDHPDRELQDLAGQYAKVETELSEANAFMRAHGFSPTIGQRIIELEALKAGLAGQVRDAREKAAHPLGESWGEAKTLLDALKQASDPAAARLRLRSLLRRIIDSIWLLVVPRGLDRIAAVQIWFTDQRRYRHYAILHRPPRSNARSHKPGQWWVRSFADVGLPAVDVRDRDQAAKLAKALESAVIDQQSGKPLPS